MRRVAEQGHTVMGPMLKGIVVDHRILVKRLRPSDPAGRVDHRRLAAAGFVEEAGANTVVRFLPIDQMMTGHDRIGAEALQHLQLAPAQRNLRPVIAGLAVPIKSADRV